MIWFKKYKIYVLMCFLVIISVESYSFKLQNIYFNQRMDGENGGYREFYIINDYLTRQRYKINVLQGSAEDGSEFVEVYPRVITVYPQSKGVVKVFAKTLSNTKQKEYNFKLQFQPINIPTLAKNKDGMTMGTSNIGIAPIIELKGYMGNINFEQVLKLENIKVIKDAKNKGVFLKGVLSNDSYASIDFGVEAYGNNNFLYGSSYIGEIQGYTKNKEIQLSFPMIENPKDLKKIIFYRTPSNIREVIKEIKL